MELSELHELEKLLKSTMKISKRATLSGPSLFFLDKRQQVDHLPDQVHELMKFSPEISILFAQKIEFLERDTRPSSSSSNESDKEFPVFRPNFDSESGDDWDNQSQGRETREAEEVNLIKK